MFKRKILIHYLVIFCVYFLALFAYGKQPLTYRFDAALLQRYALSQDITHEVPGKRLFLSDGEIHIASGYLYATGSDPTQFNFQHPPLLKYLFGYATLFFGNPYLVQVLLSLLLLFLTYRLGMKVYSSEAGLLGALLLAIDPLFISFSTTALLDLGQAVFLLAYFLLMVSQKPRYIIGGVILGLLFGAKFFGGSVFFIFLVFIYLLYNRTLDLKKYLVHILIASVVFCTLYTKTFILKNGLFNIVFFELKTVKYWFHHSVSSFFGSSALLFLTGYIKSWWGNQSLIRSDIWTFVWPVALVASTIQIMRELSKHRFSQQLLVNALPVAYLLYLGFQAPYPRYFILILPFLYVSFARVILRK